MTPRSTHTWNNTLVLLPLFALVAGCPADDEPAAAAPTTCTRPSYSATDGVYVSAHGADGCSTDTFCYVPKALTTGKCYENGTVCVPDQPDGRIDGQKYFSEYCLDEQSCLWSDSEAMGECVTGSGGTSGAAGAGGSSTGGTAGTAGSSGSGGSAVGGQGGSSGGAAGTGGSGGNVIPNEPLANVLTNGTIQMCGPDSIDFQVSALPQEVIRMRGTWTVPPGESGGLPAAEVWRLGEVVLFENNPVGFSPGLLGANSPPTSAEVVFSFYMGGPLNLRFFNTPPGCGTLSFVASFESERMGPNNYTKTTATPIDVPETINHHRGCEEERWYKFNANAGETHRLAFRGRVYPGWYYPTAYFGFTVEDETGPLPFAGSDLSFGGELKAGASLGDPIVLDQLFETTGTYYLHTPIDLPGCGLVEYEVTDTVL